MRIIVSVAAIVAVAMASAFLTGLTRRRLLRQGVVDIPNDRSMHATPVVRGAGISFAAVWIVFAFMASVAHAFANPATVAVLALFGLALAVLGLFDDHRPSLPGTRFLIQALLCVIAVACGVRTQDLWIPVVGAVPLGFASLPLCVIAILTLINLFNFMDGIDGLTGGHTTMAAAVLAIGCTITGHLGLALLSAALAAAVLGFLPFNWSPARCFMGDAGSYFCGGILAGLYLMAQDSGIPLLAVGLASVPFLLDAAVTLLVRAVTRQRLWMAHRNHLYQRLVMRGLSHSAVTLLYIVTGAALGSAGLIWLSGSRV